MDILSNKWASDESDESDEEYVANEIPPPDIDENFRKDVLDIKHNLYDDIVLGPNIGTMEAQSGEVINRYLKNINEVYILCLNAQKGIIKDNDLVKFPENIRIPLQRTLSWINQYFKKNRAPDTIPYEDYIRKSFHDYQFVQNNSFE